MEYFHFYLRNRANNHSPNSHVSIWKLGYLMNGYQAVKGTSKAEYSIHHSRLAWYRGYKSIHYLILCTFVNFYFIPTLSYLVLSAGSDLHYVMSENWTIALSNEGNKTIILTFNQVIIILGYYIQHYNMAAKKCIKSLCFLWWLGKW